MDHTPTRRAALLLFAIVILGWGLNWTISKIILQSVTPLWTVAIRSAIASLALLVALLATRQFIAPRRGDLPVVLAVALLHMGAFAVLVAYGLSLVPAGRSIVLGYTTPLWVVPGAWLFLNERMTVARLAGVALGLAGLGVMFNPLTFNWDDNQALLGNVLILVAALCWALNILYVRAHTWISTPFQLVFWQALLATVVLSALALWFDGVPRIVWTPGLAVAFLYGGILGTALPYWAMTAVNRSVPAITTSLGILATPVVGVASSAIILGEAVNAQLIIAMVMILGGIAIGTLPNAESAANVETAAR